MAATAAAETAESLAIRQKVAEYGKQIQSLKSEGKGKVGWLDPTDTNSKRTQTLFFCCTTQDAFMPIVQKMLALKAEYKKVTGRPFDPPKSKKKKGGKQQKKGGKQQKKSDAKNKKSAKKPAAAAAPASKPPRENRQKLNTQLDIEKEMQDLWAKNQAYHGKPDKTRGKFMATFPYPYMNGRLHLGHAFTISKAEFAAGFWATFLRRIGDISGPP